MISSRPDHMIPGGGKTIQVTVSLFSHLQELLGAERLICELTAVSCVSHLLDHLESMAPGSNVGEQASVILVNGSHAHPDRVLQDGDSIHLMPIIGGG